MESRSEKSLSSPQRFVAQNRPKSEWPGNIGIGPNPQTSGHNTAELPIGSNSKGKTVQPPPMTMDHCRAILLLVLATITFNSIATNQKLINVSTFNLHGYSVSSKYLRDCLVTHGGVWMLQEHWLSEQQLLRMQHLGVQYVARSGMEDAISSGVYRGRPFGGVAICWSQDLNHCFSPISNFKHKRVVAAELKLNHGNILFICVYMPYFNAGRREQCMVDAMDAISMIELLIDEHPNHHIIIGGDLNTELKGESAFDALWSELCDKNSLAHCRNMVTGPQYTYRHDSLNQTKLNDHFLISSGLSTQISNLHVLDDGDNTSDHLPLMVNVSVSTKETSLSEPTSFSPRAPRWKNLSGSHKMRYEENVERLLLERQFSFPCDKKCHCRDSHCLAAIQREYDDIIYAVTEASKQLPKAAKGVEKEWWSSNLTKLRDQSMAIQSAWIAEGRPRHGPTQTERLRVRAAYKHEIRCAKKMPQHEAWDRLHTAMIDHDSESFWKRWRVIYGKKNSSCAPVVDGNTSKEGIAKAFRTAFEKNCQPNNLAKVADLDARFQIAYRDFSDSHSSICDCAEYRVTVEDTFEAIMAMKDGKCADDDGVSAEHLKNGPLILYIKIATLFNHMLSHGHVPKQFRFGTITPIIKDKNGNHGDVNNYRGITISSTISKAFERMLKQLFSDVLSSSSYQFGFKGGSSTSHALFCLRETIDYYIDHGSRVYCSFLDASKAFDRLIHSGLFLKLIQRNIPKIFLDILITWYDGLQCRVKWDGVFGDWFPVTAGVRQGGILSPSFYNIYVDELIHILQKTGVGCYISTIFAAALFYADDMCVLSPSLHGLQKLLDCCSAYCTEWDICLNAKKTKNMFFGSIKPINVCLTLNGAPIDWVSSWKYLGVVVKSGARFGCSVTERVKSFYRALNSILRIEGRSNDMILLQLIETHCVPILSYAIETVVVVNRDEKRSMRVAYNAIFRKIFGYRSFESVSNLQHSLNRPTWEELTEKRKVGFMKRARSCSRDSLVRAFC